MFQSFNFTKTPDGRLEAVDVWYVSYNKRGGVRVVPTALSAGKWLAKRAAHNIAAAVPRWSLY